MLELIVIITKKEIRDDKRFYDVDVNLCHF